MPRQHLVKDGAKGPDVNLVAVRLASENLRRHVHWRATHRRRHVIDLLHFLRKAKIGDDDIDLTNKLRGLFEFVPLFLVLVILTQSHLLIGVLEVQKDVGKLHVAMKHLHIGQVLQTFYNLRQEISGLLLCEGLS